MKGKVLIVTGASRGIGAATARLAGQHGYRVCVNFREQAAPAQQVVRDIQAAGGEAVAVCADVASEEGVAELFSTVDRVLGPVAALVNNAGIIGRQTDIAGIDAERLQRLFATNVFGSILCAREAVRRMSRGDAIVNVSSMAARLGGPHEYLDYAATKGAIDTFTVGLAREVGARGIRVNGVRPGLIDTEMHAAGGEPGRIARLQGSIPMQRGGTAQEVAEAIIWLLSDAAAYVTGSMIDVSGGR